MKTIPSTPPRHIPKAFWTKFGSHVRLVLAGFDRLRFEARCVCSSNPRRWRFICRPVMCSLRILAVLPRDSLIGSRQRQCGSVAAKRPVRYLASPKSVRDLARIARRDRIDSGLQPSPQSNLLFLRRVEIGCARKFTWR
jgi:hypothetical protein